MQRFISLLWCLLITTACETSYKTNIPYAPVFIEVDLRYEDKDLIPISAYKVFTRENINVAIERAGFSGVLVYHGLNGAGGDTYYAFEICCPYEYRQEVKIEMDESAVFALCPTCGTKYHLIYGMGNPEGGQGRQSLLRYNITKQGDKLIVRN